MFGLLFDVYADAVRTACDVATRSPEDLMRLLPGSDRWYSEHPNNACSYHGPPNPEYLALKAKYDSPEALARNEQVWREYEARAVGTPNWWHERMLATPHGPERDRLRLRWIDACKREDSARTSTNVVPLKRAA